MYIVHTGIASDPRLNGSEAIPVVMIHCTYTYAVMTYSTTLDRAFVTELTQLDRSEFHQRQRAAVEEEEEEGGRGSNDRGSGGVVEEEGEGGRAEEGESKKHDPPLRSVSQDKVGECNVMYMYMYMLVITLYNVCKYCLFTTCCPPPPPPPPPAAVPSVRLAVEGASDEAVLVWPPETQRSLHRGHLAGQTAIHARRLPTERGRSQTSRHVSV